MPRSPNSRQCGPTLPTSTAACEPIIRPTFSTATRRSLYDDAPDALALLHQLEPLLDVRQRHSVRDHRIDLDLAVHVPVDDFRHVGAAAELWPRAAGATRFGSVIQTASSQETHKNRK